MSKRYDNSGLRFLYPENWTISDETQGERLRSVSLQTPTGGFWIAQIHAESDPHQITLQVLKTMREEYEQVEAEPVVESLAGRDLVGFDMQFCCLDLLVGASVRSVPLGSKGSNGKLTLLVMYQAEDREYDRLKPVFEAMLMNLLENLDDCSTAPSRL